MSRPIGVEELAARLVHALVSVRAEEIALGLQQVGRQAPGAVAVVKRQRRAERRRGHAVLDRLNDGAPPGSLIVRSAGLAEEVIEQQIAQLRVLVVGFLDLAQEAAADDAAAAPHQRDAAEVEVPALSLAASRSSM